MAGDWSQEITREYAGGEVRFDFPVRRLGWARLLGLFLIGFAVLFVWMPGHAAWESIQKLTRGDRDVGTIIFAVFPLIFVVAGSMPLAFGLAILFGRCRVEWRDGQLRSTEMVGPLRWTRRLPRKPLRKLEVAAATSSSGNAPPRTIQNFSGITVLYEDGSRKVLAVGYPRDWMMAVAQELRSYVGSGSPASEPVKVEVVERLTKPEEDEIAVAELPAGSKLQLEQRGAGFNLVVRPPGVWKGAKGLLFFSLMWCGFMVVFTAAAVFGKPESPESLPVAFFLFIPGFWLIGLAMLAGAVHTGRRRMVFTADSAGLRIQTSGLFGAKQREWPRGEIAAIRADASSMTVNDRPVIELQVHPRSGKKAGFLAGRDEAELRWIAANLRRALNVPARQQTSAAAPLVR